MSRRLSRRYVLARALRTGSTLVIPSWLVSKPADAAPALPTPDEQKAVGAQATEEILKKYPQVKDRRLSPFQTVGNRLLKGLPQQYRQTWDWKFYVLETKEANAFAVPGGHVFMLTGLYALMTTEDALAAVTGHELAHVYREHWAKAYVKQQQRRRVVVLGTLLAGNKGAALGWGALLATVFKQKFSREEEDEADALGLNDMVAAGYNPQGMIQLFQIFQAQGGERASAFLSDHPLTSDRIKRTQSRIAQMGSRTFPPVKPLNYAALR